MANTNSPFGFRARRHMTGGMIRLSEYSIASAYNANIFFGDPVEMTGTGKNIQLAPEDNVDSIGVFAGCRYVDSQGNQKFSKYWPAGTTATDIVALVYDDPNIVFEMQVSTIAAADVGQLVDWAAGTGSTVTGVSGAYADTATAAASNASLRIIGLVPRVDNAYGAYAKIEVVFAEHALKGVVAGVGGN
ncbi:MAG: hypothetical protein C4521_07505 [Actinobacteria bacterium]|nr:MAG: hypothetical protein C4521_07505 [Actinomycetota bacterium]